MEEVHPQKTSSTSCPDCDASNRVNSELARELGVQKALIEDLQSEVSECWVFYAVPTAKVIFMAKTSLDVFNLRREQVWTFQSWVIESMR